MQIQLCDTYLFILKPASLRKVLSGKVQSGVSKIDCTILATAIVIVYFVCVTYFKKYKFLHSFILQATFVFKQLNVEMFFLQFSKQRLKVLPTFLKINETCVLYIFYKMLIIQAYQKL